MRELGNVGEFARRESAATDERIAPILAAQRPGYPLSTRCYSDPEIFEREAERFLLYHWHCAGHESQASEPGQFFTVEICGESVIVVRGKDRLVRALINVCRHRGSRVCGASAGKSPGGFVCPYHGWSYGLDGRLRAARQAPPDFDRAAHALKPVHLRVIEGLIFISFAQDPPALDDVEQVLRASAGVHGWGDAEVAHRETYSIRANWKLAVENYMECYHCSPAHAEYSRVHVDHRPWELNREAIERLRERSRSLGIDIRDVDHWATRARSGQEAVMTARSTLVEGAVSGSSDGAPVAPLMGQFQSYEGGVTYFDVGPTSDFLAYSDHGLIYRFVPRTVTSTDMEVIWLVRRGARAGVDYDLERLTWLWRVTSAADKRIIELNQEGINSRYYDPGAYTAMEQPYTRRFIDWLLAELA